MPFAPIDGCHYAYLEVQFTLIFVDLDGFCFVIRVSFVWFVIEKL